MNTRYDAIIVGARAAGAATGLLLARAGARVLIVDREHVIGDTLSTHALLRPAVELLGGWGILDTLWAAGTPVVRQAHFQYGADRVTVPVKHRDGMPGLCAPRRWQLDRTILDAAVAAGADLSLGVSVEACVADAADRIVGVSVRRRDGTRLPIYADVVIGADGRSSRVAEMVGARLLSSSPHRAAVVYGYFPGIPNQGYRWYFGSGVAGGAIPTNDGLHCVFASCRPEDYRARFASDPAGGLRAIIRTFDPEVGEKTRAAPAERLRRYSGAPGHIRARAGRGWALVGDAAFFKDPSTAHGITDAFLDAHHLASQFGCEGGLQRYQRDRNAHAVGLFETSQTIASFDWDFDGLKTLHATLNECLKREQAALDACTPDVRAEAPATHAAARQSEGRPWPWLPHGRWGSAMRGILSTDIAPPEVCAGRVTPRDHVSSRPTGE